MRIAIYTNEDRVNQLGIVRLNSQSMKTNNFIECKTKTDLTSEEVKIGLKN